jgi:hypothetical protein
MDREKLMKMACAVRTGGKGSVRRWEDYSIATVPAFTGIYQLAK